MSAKISDGFLVLGAILMIVGTCAHAQQTVYKWVDKEGVVHFSDEPPDASAETDVEKITTDKPPAHVPAAQPMIESHATSDRQVKEPSTQPEIELPSPVSKADIKSMSLEELDRRCEDAREAKSAPLREAEIAKCKSQEKNDPAWCERFNADYGDGGKTKYGTYRPRMFHDLPECLEADQERRERF